MLTSNHVIFMEYKNSDLFQGFLFKFWSLMELNVLWTEEGIFLWSPSLCGLLFGLSLWLVLLRDLQCSLCLLQTFRNKDLWHENRMLCLRRSFFFKLRCWDMSSVSTSFYYCSHFSEKVIFWIKTNSSQSESMWTVDALLTATTVTSSIQRSILKRSKSKLRLRPSF